jgi:adsorption protein B
VLDFELTQAHLNVLEYIMVAVAMLILVSSLDDLFIDAVYWKERLRRAWLLGRRCEGAVQISPAQLLAKSEQPLAIMVPAWKESDVIAAMVENLVATMNYRNYHVFIGTYVNDPPTIEEVERVRRRYPHVHRVEVPHPGPTCKADCLNFLVEAIQQHEKECGTCFAGVILHDSEDVLDPLELRYFNHMLPRHDMIQLPVISLPRKWNEWVAGTYMDEFAESHKEMLVREHLSGSVPSAGVGTCFSRRALVALVGSTRNRPFNTDSLTEDYDIGMRLAKLGMRSTFGWLPQSPGAQGWVKPMSVAEYFPDQFRTAMRQKARWVLGIGLQGWHQIPWRGRPAGLKYLLLHDRKGVVTSFVSVAAYVLLAVLLLLKSIAGEGWPYPQFSGVTTEPWFGELLVVNMAFLANRLGHRYYFTARLYGWRQGLLSWPRMVVGNFVNCFAVGRAWNLYLQHVMTGRALAWDKTMHNFPTAAQLGRARQRLGELLVSWQAVAQARLDQALLRQKATGLPLGKVLVQEGLIDEDLLADAIAYQADLPRGTVMAAQSRACRDRVSAKLAFSRHFVPLGLGQAGKLLIGVAAPLPPDAVAQIGAETGLEPLQRILRDSEIGASLEFLFRGEPGSHGANMPQWAQKVG